MRNYSRFYELFCFGAAAVFYVFGRFDAAEMMMLCAISNVLGDIRRAQNKS